MQNNQMTNNCALIYSHFEYVFNIKMKSQMLFIFAFLINYFKCRLLCVLEINRHGARTTKNFMTEKLNALYGGNMQLTVNGYRQQQILGEYVKNKFINNKHFLKPEFDSGDFQITSSPTQRTIFSAAGFAAGLYPGNIIRVDYDDDKFKAINNDTIPVANNELTISEIPIRVIDPAHDSLFHSLKCKFEGKELKQYLKTKNNETLFSLTDEAIGNATKEMENLLGIKVNTTFKANHTKENIFTELDRYLWVYLYHTGQKIDNAKLSPQAIDTIKKWKLNKSYMSRLNDTKYLRLSSSEILNSILSRFEHAIDQQKGANNTDEPPKKNGEYKKFTVYLAHDTNMINIISNLVNKDKLREYVLSASNNPKMFKFLLPPFASIMLFELHYDEEEEKYYVHINYNGKFIDKDLKGIPNEAIVNSQIRFEHFQSLMNSIIDHDYELLDCTKLKVDEIIDQRKVEKKVTNNNRTSERKKNTFLK